ncbi:MAG: Asp-tRNA(Asn)/Glu-tRNA(Gln) amidotransferase subunit GatC [Bacillota bacterium]|uniref:Aspartyl/glutamyl-tRNA(Asn/Gln) amidotransferase subunit C n=1 Tax=Thermanaerosceptrum fracticalcis TaxID=1712410 RepID=A0A7G6E6J3_THEFR|nr:Asp-tRNA(Asn)/Glu-tRNA(Gln) amidotransferase subunit GatC [Thermanaerosceptrum fracticalcis]QNB47697.1 Asp-tRNA(Asn)/Glu-tRNA(Gln) amidotransferase subunit GatC [Thermanaerosceptrum fracticalcis]
MKITVKDVEHVALLARLDLTEQDKEKYTQSLNAILEYMEKLNQIDTSNVEPTAHVLPLKNVFREDKLHRTMDKELVLANAPEEEDGCFKVPRIV